MRPKKVILCVDDNEQELSVLKFMLQTNGYKVLAAVNGQEAVSVFVSAPQIDLVLADSHMPQMSGRQLSERLKRIAGHVPIILLGEVPAGNTELHAADPVMVRKNCSVQDRQSLVKLGIRQQGSVCL
jgi:two-component system, OmpR family, response regulator CpxR